LSVEDVSQLLPEGEGQPQQPEPTAPEPQPEPQPEPYRLKYRGEEREIPPDPVNGLAEALGTTPEGVINALQRAREADRIFRENIAYKQQIAEQQAQAAQYQERLGGGQAPPVRQQPYAPQYQPPPPQYQAPPPGQDEDAFVYLRRIDQGYQQTQRQLQDFIQWQQDHQQRLEQQQMQVYQQQQAAEINSQLARFLTDKNKGRREQIELEDFAQEVMLSGGSNPHMPLDQAAERAWAFLTRDEQIQQARSETIDRLQQRRAVVTVPGRTAAAPPPPAPSAADQLGGMTVEQMREFFPERR